MQLEKESSHASNHCCGSVKIFRRIASVFPQLSCHCWLSHYCKHTLSCWLLLAVCWDKWLDCWTVLSNKGRARKMSLLTMNWHSREIWSTHQLKIDEVWLLEQISSSMPPQCTNTAWEEEQFLRCICLKNFSKQHYFEQLYSNYDIASYIWISFIAGNSGRELNKGFKTHPWNQSTWMISNIASISQSHWFKAVLVMSVL